MWKKNCISSDILLAPAWGPRPSPAKRVGWGRRRKGAGEGFPLVGTPSKADFAPTKEQGISRLLTINLNDVEKELHIK